MPETPRTLDDGIAEAAYRDWVRSKAAFRYLSWEECVRHVSYSPYSLMSPGDTEVFST